MPLKVNSATTYSLVFIILSLILINNSVVCYSLDGTWTINPTYLKNSPSNQTTIVDFQKVIQSDNVTIAYQMTIFSCLTLEYTYKINDNDIYLTYNSTTTSIVSYTCSNNQISQIRVQLQKVFYFIIVADSLSFLDPAGNILFQMTKNKPNFQSLSGIWSSLTALSTNIYTSLYINGTEIYLCNGAAVIDYSYVNGSNNKINFSIVSATGCDQNQVLTALYKSAYYRWQNQIVHFYDQNAIQLMTMQELTVFVNTQPLSVIFNISNNQSFVNSSNNSINSSVNSSSSSTIKPPINSTISTTNSSMKSSTNSSTHSSINSSENSPTNSSTNFSANFSLKSNLSSNSPLNTSSSSSQSTSNITQSSFSLNSTIQNASLPVQSGSNSSSTSSHYNSSSLPIYTSASQLPGIAVSQFQNKWFVQLIINSDGTIGDSTQYSSYFILILPTRIMIYGDCNVHYSSYTLTGNMISNISVQSTTTTCPASPAEAQNLINNLSKWYYVAVQGKTLRVWDKNMNEILQLSSN